MYHLKNDLKIKISITKFIENSKLKFVEKKRVDWSILELLFPVLKY